MAWRPRQEPGAQAAGQISSSCCCPSQELSFLQDRFHPENKLAKHPIPTRTNLNNWLGKWEEENQPN